MSENQSMKEKIEQELNEDDIIKEIMLDYPDLYDMLEFTEFTIKEKLEMNPYWYQNFRLRYVAEKRKLNKIKDIMDAYTGRLYHRLRFENDIKLGKIEAEKYYIPKDDKYREFRNTYLRQEIRVETYEAITKAFERQGFTMNTFVKNMEL